MIVFEILLLLVNSNQFSFIRSFGIGIYFKAFIFNFSSCHILIYLYHIMYYLCRHQ